MNTVTESFRMAQVMDRRAFLGGLAALPLVGGMVGRAEGAQDAPMDGLIERVRVVRGDVRNQQTVERAIGEYEVATVLHLAAQTTVGVANRNPTPRMVVM